MSVIVNGMDMPEKCSDCRFKWHGDSTTYCLALSDIKREPGKRLHHIKCHPYYAKEEGCPLVDADKE